MNASLGKDTIRLTMAQAVVKYLQAQYSERDGKTAPPDPGDVRHLRPRQRLRHGPGTRGMRPGPAVLPAVQRAVDGPYGDRLRQGQPAAGHPGLHGVDRARLDQHDHRRGRGDDQPPAGAPVPLRLLRDPAPGAGAPAARASGLGGCQRQRLLPAGQPLLRSDHPPRADPDRPARGDARADRSGRDGHRHDRAAAGHPGPRVTIIPPHFFREARLAGRASPARSRADRRGGRAAQGGPAAGDPRRRRRALLGGLGRAAGVRRRARESRSARRSPARARCGIARRWRWAGTAWKGRAPPRRSSAGPTW